jgi:solute carrier family 39 (zinc transporter), member 9
MLFVEQIFLPSLSPSPSVEDGYALAPDRASFEGARSSSNLHARIDSNGASTTPGGSSSIASRHARSITFGLVIHSLADGLALGASSFSRSSITEQAPLAPQSHTIPSIYTLDTRSLSRGEPSGDMMDQIRSTNPLTLIVFLALIIHKIPTALALATSLLPLLPPRKIRVHVAIFSIATPLGALLSLMLLGIISAGTKGGTSEKQSGLWAGMALAFSGGTFLYVATVLQPVRKEAGEPQSQHGHAHPGEDGVQTLGSKQRVLLIIFGMFLPIAVSSMIGHGHEQSHS